MSQLCVPLTPHSRLCRRNHCRLVREPPQHACNMCAPNNADVTWMSPPPPGCDTLPCSPGSALGTLTVPCMTPPRCCCGRACVRESAFASHLASWSTARRSSQTAHQRYHGGPTNPTLPSRYTIAPIGHSLRGYSVFDSTWTCCLPHSCHCELPVLCHTHGCLQGAQLATFGTDAV